MKIKSLILAKFYVEYCTLVTTVKHLKLMNFSQFMNFYYMKRFFAIYVSTSKYQFFVEYSFKGAFTGSAFTVSFRLSKDFTCLSQ